MPRSNLAAPRRPEPSSFSAAPPVATASDGAVHSHARYGARQRPNGVALAIALSVQGLIMLMLLGLGTQQARQHVQNHVVAINLNGAKPTKPDTPAPSPEPEKLASSVTPQPAVTVLPPPARILVHEPTAPAALAPAALVTMPAAAPAIPAAPPADRPSAVASANSGTPATTSGNISGIRMLSGNPPSYPYESRRKKEQGTVRLHLLLGTDGRVETIGIASSSGFARLDKAALKAVKHWRWEPVVRNGKPVRIEGELEIPFVLNT